MPVVQRRMPNGQELSVVDPAEAALLYREIFVEKSYLRDGFPPSPPGVVFDIGANIGLASLFLKKQYPDAFIVAVEPGPDPFISLQKNFERHIPDGVVHNVAVAGHSGTARFGYYPKSPAESGLYVDRDREIELAKDLLEQTGVSAQDADRISRSRHELSFVECRTVTLSELIGESAVDRVDLLKIDVEKAECDVLAGIEPGDWPRIQNVVIEVHDMDGRLERVCGLLRAQGFDVAAYQESRLVDTNMHNLFATRP
ncbi:methyltransferase, FkbM family [Amycolatopsis arida]|uniref:Methyltransferase, FkbM family n=1 Tax=Amycolatopsis arida TaxID=587909 RepID=A0A1I5QBH8_9PSEU|nr:FkbM family methyltransferase [Amycolatopsis arida]TDX98777.1 FkbM family methyltransferase [Amycolatopsis arida]SFP43457.1 methyltransferase, FkbM family [Amycolatopsis arida]